MNEKKDNKEIKKEEFKQTNPNYHSGIIETKKIEEKTKPSYLIIFIIIVAIFFGEIIYITITNKKSPDEIENSNNTSNDESIYEIASNE